MHAVDTTNTKWAKEPQYAVEMRYEEKGVSHLVQRDETFVFNSTWNGTPIPDSQIFYLEQAPDFIVPASEGNLLGAPEPGLTNEQNWQIHGIAIAGSVTPCLDTRPEIYGFVCSLSQEPRSTVAPHAPTNVNVIVSH
jgi:hypothetical protein